MDWGVLLKEIFEVCLIPLLGVLTSFLIVLIKKKAEEIAQRTQNDLAKKYIQLLGDTVAQCVAATNQTYVENLKTEQLFDAEAQREAFQQTFNAVMAILSDEAKVYLTELLGDLDEYVTAKIEAEVAVQK